MPPQFFLLRGQLDDSLFQVFDLPAQFLPADQQGLRVQQFSEDPVPGLFRLRLAGGKLCVRFGEGGRLHADRHPAQQLALPFLQGGPALSRLEALFAGLLLGGLEGRLCLVKLRLCGGLVGHLGRGGVMGGSAHGAGLPLGEGLGQDARLLVQESPVLLPVVRPRPLLLAPGRLVISLRLFQGLAGLLTVPGEGDQLQDKLQPLLDLRLPAEQLFLLGGQPPGGKPKVPLLFQEPVPLLQTGGHGVPPGVEGLAGRLPLPELPVLVLPCLEVPRQGGQDGLTVLGAFPLSLQPFPLRPHLRQGGVFPPQGVQPDCLLLTLPVFSGLVLPYLRDLFRQGLELLLSGGQALIPRGILLQRGHLPGQHFLLWGLALLLLQSRSGLLHGGLLRPPPFHGLRELSSGFFCLLRLGQLGCYRLLLFVQPVQNGLGLLIGCLVPADQGLDQLQCLLKRPSSRPCPLQDVPQGVILGTGYPGDVLLHAGPEGIPVSLQLAGLSLEPFLKNHVVPGLENLPKNLLSGFGVRQEELEKVSLGNHGDLGELFSVQADDFDDLAVHVLHPGH